MDLSLLILATERELDELVLRSGVVPEGETETALMVQGRALHPLTRHDPSAAQVIRCAVSHNSDCIAALLKPDAELKAGVATSNDTNRPHSRPLPLPTHVTRSVITESLGG